MVERFAPVLRRRRVSARYCRAFPRVCVGGGSRGGDSDGAVRRRSGVGAVTPWWCARVACRTSAGRRDGLPPVVADALGPTRLRHRRACLRRLRSPRPVDLGALLARRASPRATVVYGAAAAGSGSGCTLPSASTCTCTIVEVAAPSGAGAGGDLRSSMAANAIEFHPVLGFRTTRCSSFQAATGRLKQNTRVLAATGCSCAWLERGLDASAVRY